MTRLEFYNNVMDNIHNIRYADIGIEYFFNKRSIEWLMANYDKSRNAICAVLKKLERYTPTSTTETPTKYIDSYTLCNYLISDVCMNDEEALLVLFAFGLATPTISDEAKLSINRVLAKLYIYMKADNAIYVDSCHKNNCGVSMGELNNPFYSCHLHNSFGRYYSLPVHLRPLFNEMVEKAKEDAPIVICGLFGGMSRAGIADCFNISPKTAASIVNKYTRGMHYTDVRPSTRAASKMEIDDFFYMLVNNDICEHPTEVVKFLNTKKSVEEFVEDAEGLELEQFRYEVANTLTQMYRLMRNNKKVLVMDKADANISSYTSINEPFSSPYLRNNAKHGCI